MLDEEPSLSMKLKIREPGRSAFSIISFKYQIAVDHPVSVAQELVAENHVHGHDYILVAANIDKVLTSRGKNRFTLHKIEGKGQLDRQSCRLCLVFSVALEKEPPSYAEISIVEVPLTAPTATTTTKSLSSSGLRSAGSVRDKTSTHQTAIAIKTEDIITPATFT